MIENTIYRFATVRPPQIFTDEELSAEVQFVSPAGLEVVSADNIADWEYEPYMSSIADIKGEHNELYQFAIWVKTNRANLEVSELQSRANSVNSIPDAILTRLFNDLIFYVYKQPDIRLATAISNLLYANHLENYVNGDTEYQLDKLLNAVVQLPESFKIGFKPQENTFVKRSSISEDRRAISQSKVEFYDQVLEDLRLVEKQYNVRMLQEQRRAEANYDAALKQAQDNATFIEPLYDENTGTLTRPGYYEGLTAPEFIKPEVDDTAVIELVASGIHPDTESYLYDVIGKLSYNSFSDIREHVSAEQKKEITHLGKIDSDGSGTSLLYKGVVLNASSENEAKTVSVTLCVLGFSFFSRKRYFLKISGLDSSVDLARMSGTVTLNNGTNIDLNTLLDDYDNTRNPHRLLVKNNLITDGIKRVTGQFEYSDGSRLQIDETLDLPAKPEQACYMVGHDYQPAEVEVGSGTGEMTTPAIPEERFGMLRLGIMDYRKVIQTVCCYVPGEVSHIENIMAREFKSKTTTRKRTVDTYDLQISESESETLQENVTTDRNEIANEVVNIATEDRSRALAAGTSVTYTDPMLTVQATGNGSFSSSSSTENSNVQAVTHAQEITERALERVVTRVISERSRRVIEEYTQTDEHGFDNRKGDSHVSGVYRWVDKIYKNELLNYGKRLIYEFMIPEPASFHNQAVQALAKNDGAIIMDEPIDPRKSSSNRIYSSDSTSDSDIFYWATIFNVEIEPRPLNTMNSGVAEDFTTPFTGTGAELDETSSISGEFDVPEGYVTKKAHVSFRTTHEYINKAGILVGNLKRTIDSATSYIEIPKTALENYTKVPYSFYTAGHHAGAFNINFELEVTNEFLNAWRSRAISKILQAYEERRREYENQLRSIETNEHGLNPMFYREMEQNILRKHCIAYMMRNQAYAENHLAAGVPVQSQELEDYANLIKFMEQAFEWNIMSYELYPWYWAAQSRQNSKYTLMEGDSTFRAFLRSGMARVLVTVKPGYEEAVSFFMATGLPWNGSDVIGVEDEEFINIINDLREPTAEPEDTWTTRVPTTLTVIQASSIGLDVEGLPCNNDCGELLFDTDASGAGYTNPIGNTKAQVGQETTSDQV